VTVRSICLRLTASGRVAVTDKGGVAYLIGSFLEVFISFHVSTHLLKRVCPIIHPDRHVTWRPTQ
jgi:hypothetical protein